MVVASSRVLSLDKEGRNVIDNAGNCGMETKYDEHGWDVEDRSFGPDLKAMPVTDGYAIVKTQYDQHGRSQRQTFHDVNGKPVVLPEEGYHSWEAAYEPSTATKLQ